MKKAKILLSALAVLAVTGGVLAFKAIDDSQFKFFTLDNSGSKCNKEVFLNYTTASPTTTIPYTTVSFEGTSGDEELPCYSVDVAESA